MGQNPRANRVYFDRIFHRSYWTWRKHPSIIVPTMLASGLTAIEEAALTMPVIVYATILASSGSLTRFLNDLSAGTGCFGLSTLFNDSAFSLGLLSVIVIIAIAVPLIAILGGGFVLSAEYGTYLEAWTNSSVPVGNVIQNGRRNWRRAAWTLLLSDVITWGPAAVGVSAFVLFAPGICTATSASINDVFALVLYGLLAAILVVVSLILSIFTLYSIPITIIEQTSGPNAIVRSFRFSASHFRTTLTYGVVRVIFQFLSFILIGLASLIGLPLSSLGTILLSLLLTPILHSTKTMIYSYGRQTEAEMPFELAEPIWSDITLRLPRAAWRKMRIGLSEISHFLLSPRNLPFHILSTLSLILGIVLGDYVSANGLVNFLGIQPGTINPAVVQSFGPVLGVDIFLNNWLVSIATGLAGLGFGLPAFQTILFNGFIVGIIIPAFQNLTMLLAGLLPHGIIEIPSLVISGSIGLKLGWAAVKARLDPSPENQEFLSVTLRQTVYIVVGLAPLFLIAGTIEGNITPIIMRWFGWTG